MLFDYMVTCLHKLVEGWDAVHSLVLVRLLSSRDYSARA